VVSAPRTLVSCRLRDGSYQQRVDPPENAGGGKGSADAPWPARWERIDPPKDSMGTIMCYFS
jgi:hypothetical protein